MQISVKEKDRQLNTTRYYTLLENIDFQLFANKITKNFRLTKTDSKKLKETILDTFDWRLYQKDILLKKTENDFSIISLLGNEPIYKHLKSSKKNYKFWWDFPDSSIQDILKSYISIRALIPCLSLSKQIDTYRILNEDEKTIAFLKFYDVDILKNELQSNCKTICLKPVRGYRKEFLDIQAIIKQFKTKEVSLKEIYQVYFESVNLIPGFYSSKFNLKLSPKQNTQKASQRILKYLLNIMQQNEQGIINDIDTEYLHDFRVATRRTRSALSQIKGIFPKDKLLEFKNDFAFLGKQSNRLRDLDVYILNKEKYRKLIPPQLRKGLDPMFANLLRERKRELNKFVNYLHHESYLSLIDKWEKFLQQNLKKNDQDILENAIVSVKLASKKFILKKYKDIRKIGKSITNESDDEILHALRIECKKLRYLLEFFSSLYPQEKTSLLIKNLKKLQDNLGDFNDYYIQQLDLINYLENKIKLNKDTRIISAAIGSLISVLNKEQNKVRNDFTKTYSEFSNNQNEKLFNEVFG